jgi:ribosomal protein L12E/L44/L45/RPP1/RPP2
MTSDPTDDDDWLAVLQLTRLLSLKITLFVAAAAAAAASESDIVEEEEEEEKEEEEEVEEAIVATRAASGVALRAIVPAAV